MTNELATLLSAIAHSICILENYDGYTDLVGLLVVAVVFVKVSPHRICVIIISQELDSDLFDKKTNWQHCFASIAHACATVLPVLRALPNTR